MIISLPMRNLNLTFFGEHAMINRQSNLRIEIYSMTCAEGERFNRSFFLWGRVSHSRVQINIPLPGSHEISSPFTASYWVISVRM